jgi:hypothetical protein
MPGHTPLPRVRCTVVRLDAGRPVPVTTARPGDELFALVELAHHAPGVLVLDVCRGDSPRGRWPLHISGPARLAYRLRWRDRPTASARLVVRVWCGDVLLASQTVLLLPGPADAQGRLPARAPLAPASDATRLAFLERLDDLFDEPP